MDYRNPGPWRGKPRVGSAAHVAFPVDPVDPVDPLDPVDPDQNSGRLILTTKNERFWHILLKMITFF